MIKRTSIALAFLMQAGVLFAQAPKQDKAEFREWQPGYYQNTIMKGIQDANQETKPPKRIFKADISGLDYPNDPAQYKQAWHNKPVSQGNTGTCWCFSTTSFYESEIQRMTGQQVKLSEMYTVYWHYVSRAEYFVDHRGDMTFGEGSETNALAMEMKKHGIVPAEDYLGRNPKMPFYDQSKMYAELDNYLKSVKDGNDWNRDVVVSTTKSILDHYMSAPPESVTVKGKKMSPQDYLSKVLKLNLDDYVNFMSLMQSPFYETAEYKVGDNWWHGDNYNNVPLNDFTGAIKQAIDNGYTMSIGGDVSEVGFDGQNNVAFIPTFDIPSAYINDAAREMRFLNGSTTDDHAMQLVGYADKGGKTWYLIKDSSAGSRTVGEGSKSFGYYYMSEDYVKLKMMTITVNKNAVKDVLAKMKKA